MLKEGPGRNARATGLELTVTAARAKAQATGFGTRVRNAQATGVELTVTVARAEAQATGFVPPRQECPAEVSKEHSVLQTLNPPAANRTADVVHGAIRDHQTVASALARETVLW